MKGVFIMRKKIGLVILLVLLILGFGKTGEVKAATTKTYTISITKEYEAVRISAVFNDISRCNVLLKSPSGTYYEAISSDNSSATFVVNTPEVGEWSAVVSTSLNNLEGFKITAKGLSDAATTISKPIDIASDIIGLKIYMIDDTLHCSWNNSGRVSVKVTNAKTLQVLDSKTVDSTDLYSYTITDKSIEEVLVYLVPSTSSSIENAGIQYTVPVKNELDGQITFESVGVTNSNTIKAYAKLNKPYRVEVYGDGLEQINTELLDAGEYEFDLETQVGRNQFIAYVVDENGNKNSFTMTMYKDVIAPDLSLNETANNITVYEEVYNLKGYADGYEILLVNKKEVTTVYDDGSFLYEYRLKEGINNINVVAIDEAGNQSTLTLSVNYIIGAPKSTETPFLIRLIMVVPIFAVIILITRFLFKKVSVKQNEDDYDEYDDDEYDEDNYEEDDYDENEDSEDNENEIEEKKQGKKTFLKRTETHLFANKFNELINSLPFNKNDENEANFASDEEMAEICDDMSDYNEDDIGEFHDIKIPIEKESVINDEPLKRIKRFSLFRFLFSIISFIIVILVLTQGLLLFSYVSSASMMPTLAVGDIIVFNRLAYVKDIPQAGDIICFTTEESSSYICKRILGIPGDEITFENGYLVINGVKCIENYVMDDSETNSSLSYTVPEGCYFVLGDNRENSIDSRFFKTAYIPIENIKGKLLGNTGINLIN